MSRKLYKYFSADVLELVFLKEESCSIKFSKPEDYNDPYELFLGVDLSVTLNLLASYNEIVRELPQHPTTCFSKSPAVAPMWAHYAENHSGFVIEFDLDAIQGGFERILIRDVSYKDEPSDSIAKHLHMAAGTKKPRHAYFLQQIVMSEAYFSKHTSWSYEQECRLVDQEGHCDDINGNMILHLPISCCSSIIVGAKSSKALSKRSQEIAQRMGLRWFKAEIGRSSAQPYLKASDDSRAVFDGSELVSDVKVCTSCSEPSFSDNQLCPWCSITNAHAISAAQGNPLRILDDLGLLENYFEEMSAIARSRSRNKS